MPDGQNTSGIGASLRRKEDKRFLTGKGRYTDDISKAGQLIAYFLRSDVAHANIKSIDTSAAAKADGVAAVYTGADVAEDGIGGPICGWVVKNRDGSDTNEPPHPVLQMAEYSMLATMLRWWLPETLDQAQAAAELIKVELKPCHPLSIWRQLLPDRKSMMRCPAIIILTGSWVMRPPPHRRCRTPPRAVTATLWHQPRGAKRHGTALRADRLRCADRGFCPCIRQAEPASDPPAWCSFVIQRTESKLHVVAPDVGGGFWIENLRLCEEVCCLWAARKLERPVKWTTDRTRAFLTDAHGRDHINKVQMALDENNRITGLRVDTLANIGSYLSAFSVVTPTILQVRCCRGAIPFRPSTCVSGMATTTTRLMPIAEQAVRRQPICWNG